MILNLGSLAFNVPVRTGGNTPSWGTEMGQGFDYKFSFEGMGTLFTAFAYNAIGNCRQRVYCPLGKGGNRQEDFEYVIAGLFKKVFVNDIFVPNAQFVMLVVKQINGDHHNGRRSLKYNPKITLDNQSINQDCLNKVQMSLGIKSEAAWFIHEIDFRNQDELHFTAYVLNGQETIEYINAETRKRAFIDAIDKNKPYTNDKRKVCGIDFPNVDNIQQIFYGAPGTGKSHAVKVETEEWEKQGRVVRTTFHPDSDYSTFVGAYKPTTESVQRYDIYNKPMTRDGVPVMEQIITYEFVEQAFLQAYIDAWKNRENPEFLVIEEINRGNCAQIFGDLFQLLDRGDNGYSEYAIRADKDLQKHLCKAFEDVEIEDYPNVKAGKELLLPSNLYIRATMNTSDQSLFPIDSAFKRRWDWKYVPIAKGSDNGTDLNWMVEVDGDLYDWWSFVKTINKHVFDTTNSEDKQLGFFFCRAKDNVISAETFVCKVIFYLWNDVFKDFGFDDSIFEDKEDSVNPKLSFEKFYLANGKVNEEKVIMFLKNLGMMPMEDNNRVDSIDSKTLFKINGKSTNKLNAVPYMAIAEYVRLHPDKTAQEVVDIWEPFKKYSEKSWIVCNKQDYDTDPTRYAKYSQKIPCADGQSLWVNKDGWMHNPAKQRDTIAEFIKAVNEAGFGIRITEDAI